MVNVRIQKSAKASAIVVHVDKIKMCKGEVPNSWMGEPEERLSDRVECEAFIDLFNDNGGARDAEIVNDIDNDIEEEEKRARPKRNVQMPARYIQRMYAINDVNKNYDCCRDDFREVEGFGAYEDVESVEGEADEKDHIEVAGRTFITAKLQLPLPGETGRSIEKMRGALRGMWIGAIPRTCGIDAEPKTPVGPGPVGVFGEGPGPMGNIQGGLKDNLDRQGNDTEREGTARAKELFERRRRGGSECHHHGPFLGDVLPGTLRMKRGVAAVTTMIPMENEEDDALATTLVTEPYHASGPSRIQRS